MPLACFQILWTMPFSCLSWAQHLHCPSLALLRSCRVSSQAVDNAAVLARPCAGQGAAPGVDPGQKGVALRCLAGACESGQLLVDVFVNYDCDLEGANLFERLVLALVRTAQAPPAVTDASSAAAAEEAHLRLLVRTLQLICAADCPSVHAHLKPHELEPQDA